VALTGYGRNYAAEMVAKEKLKFVTVYQGRVAGVAQDKPTSGTAVGASLINMTGSKALGYTNNKIVFIETLTASVTGLVANRPYFVVGEATNGFELAETEGGTPVKVAGVELKTETEFCLLSEETCVARIATGFAAGAGDASVDATTRKIKVKAGKRARYAVWYEVEAVGTGKAYAAAKLAEEETYAAEGTYELTSDTLEAPYVTA
jgi:hypothetical protein